MIMRARGLKILIHLVLVFGWGAFTLDPPASAEQPFIDKLLLSDTIQPVTEGQLNRAIAQANSDGAQALLVQLDTPGGLLDSTRGMVGAILSSRVPVIVYVSPAGARADSSRKNPAEPALAPAGDT